MRTIIIFFLWLFSFNIFAQSPEGINYQAIIRDSSGIILSNQSISLKISITLPPPSSTLEYAEAHNVTTDDLGLVNIVIGQGTYIGGSLSVFSALDWSQNQYWLMLDMDPNAGTSYTSMGHQQLMSVPYALYAQSSGSGGTLGTTGPQGPSGPSGTDGTSGTQGPTGQSGADGIPGSKGATGPQGIAGIQGPTGPSGADGTPGSKGATGPQGIAGIQGPTGPSGADGSAGTQGVTGPSGLQGSTGPSGVDGSAGAQGATGPQGDSATDDQNLSLTADSLLIDNGAGIALDSLNDNDWIGAPGSTNMSANIANNGQVNVPASFTAGADNAQHRFSGNVSILPSLCCPPNNSDGYLLVGTSSGPIISGWNSALQVYGNNNSGSPVIIKHVGPDKFSGISLFNNIDARFDITLGGTMRSGYEQNYARLVTSLQTGSAPDGMVIGHLSNNAPIIFLDNSKEVLKLEDNELTLYGDSSGTVSLKASNYSTATTYTLPANDGNFGHFLRTDGSGSLSWESVTDSTAVSGSSESDGDWVIDSSNATYNMYSAVNGSVGIGVSNPSQKLDIGGSLNVGGAIYLPYSSILSGNATMWGVNTDYMKISNQKVGIAPTISGYFPDAQLHVNSYVENNGTTERTLLIASTNKDQIDMNKGTGVSLEFNVPMHYSDRGELGASIDVARTDDDDQNSSASMIFSTTGDDEVKNEAMTIDENGMVGIGDTDPNARLEVADYGSQIINSSDTFIANIHGYHNPGLLVHTGYNDGVDIARFSSIGSGYVEIPRMVIKDNGNVGIGTSSPSNKLHIYSDDSVNSRGITIHSKRYARMHIKSDNYWAGIELRRDSSGEAGRPHIDFTNNYTDNYGIRVSASNDSTLNIEGGILDINEQIKIRGGYPGAGKVLMSDDYGVASWSDNISSKIEYAGNEVLNAVIHDNEEFWAKVNISSNNPDGTFIGFVYDNKNSHLYTTHRKSGSGASELTTIKKFELDLTGTPSLISTSGDLQIGHAQNLSIEYDDMNDKIYLWTSNSSLLGATRIDASDLSIKGNYNNIIPSGYTNAISCISTNGKYFIMNAYNGTENKIFVFSLLTILNQAPSPKYQFFVNSGQNNSSSQLTKGILCDNDNIYCLTGDDNTGNKKKLYAYTLNGDLIYKHKITAGQDWSISRGSVWDANSLALYHPHPNIKALLVGVSSGGSISSNKRIYSIGLGKAMWTLDGSKHPSGIALHLQGTSSDITYEYDEALQFGQYGTPSGSSSTSDPVFTERMQLNSNGNLGIGAVPSNAKLEVNGDAIISGTITSTNFSCSSDRRLKKNIRPINNALERLLKLRGAKYKWIQNDSIPFDQRYHYGVIAQEIEEQFPALIDNHGISNKIKHVEYNGFNAIFIEAFKEQQGQIDILKNKREAQKKNIKTLQEDAELIKERSIEIERKINDALKELKEIEQK